jgi:hypothetical protein
MDASDEALDAMAFENEEGELETPDVISILRVTGIERIQSATARSAVLAAMRSAAENRLAGVTDKKRRRHYSHAADIASTCAACDSSTDSARWLSEIRQRYRRFSALRSELDRALQR